MERSTAFAGIICEWNPLHKGHALLLQKARADGATHIIGVMAGNFVQRGEPAILSKWARAEAAVQCGADLVLELPLSWAMAGAERFAAGGIAILSALGQPCTLYFGSEVGDPAPLRAIAEALLSPAFSTALHEELQNGTSFAHARVEAVRRLCGDASASLLCKPNNILGVEYCKAILRQNSPLSVSSVPRFCAGHDDHRAAPGWSASPLRDALREGKSLSAFVPEASAQILARELEAGRAPVSLKHLERPVLAALRSMQEEEYHRLPDCSEGIENRLFDAVRDGTSIDEICDTVTSKRYPRARVRRLILSAFLGLRAPLPTRPSYLRLLAMNDRGAEALSILKHSAALPLITRFSEVKSLSNEAASLFAAECHATDLYALAMPKPHSCGLDQRASVRYIRESAAPQD